MRLALLLLLASCAALDTSTMKPSCRAAYNACLNRCPSAQNADRRPVDSPNSTAPKWLMVDVASCTQACNEDAKFCR